MWKFHDFSISQILGEINFEYSRSANSAKNGKNDSFEALDYPKLISRKI